MAELRLPKFLRDPAAERRAEDSFELQKEATASNKEIASKVASLIDSSETLNDSVTSMLAKLIESVDRLSIIMEGQLTKAASDRLKTFRASKEAADAAKAQQLQADQVADFEELSNIEATREAGTMDSPEDAEAQTQKEGGFLTALDSFARIIQLVAIPYLLGFLTGLEDTLGFLKSFGEKIASAGRFIDRIFGEGTSSILAGVAAAFLVFPKKLLALIGFVKGLFTKAIAAFFPKLAAPKAPPATATKAATAAATKGATVVAKGAATAGGAAAGSAAGSAAGGAAKGATTAAGSTVAAAPKAAALSGKAAKMVAGVKGIVRFLGKVPGLSVIGGVADAITRISDLNAARELGQINDDEYRKGVTTALAGAATGTAGGIIGATLGTVVGGPLGTLGGGILGYLGGDKVGSFLAGKLWDAFVDGDASDKEIPAEDLQTMATPTPAQGGGSGAAPASAPAAPAAGGTVSPAAVSSAPAVTAAPPVRTGVAIATTNEQISTMTAPVSKSVIAPTVMAPSTNVQNSNLHTYFNGTAGTRSDFVKHV